MTKVVKPIEIDLSNTFTGQKDRAYGSAISVQEDAEYAGQVILDISTLDQFFSLHMTDEDADRLAAALATVARRARA